MDKEPRQKPASKSKKKKARPPGDFVEKNKTKNNKKNTYYDITKYLKKIQNIFPRPEIIMAILTFLIVIFTFQQNRISRDLTEISDQTLKVSNRAYIVLDNVKCDIYFMDNREIIATFINSGNTPAYNIRVSGQIKPAKKEFAEITASPYTSGGAMIGKGGDINITETFERQFTANEKIKISKKEIFVFYLGYLTYNDIFGDFHCIEFCAVYDPTKGEFGYCSKNNEPCTYIK